MGEALLGDGLATTNCPYLSRNARSAVGLFGVQPAEGARSVAPMEPLSRPLGFNLSSCDVIREAKLFLVGLTFGVAGQPFPLS